MMLSESQYSVELYTLDISQPLKPSSLSSLAEACRAWGFFYITNHGISNDLFNKLFSISKQLFSLPSETKLKLGPFSSRKTYTPPFIASPFFESLRVSGPDFLASAQSSADILFHGENSQSFSEILQEYGSKMAQLSKKIVEILLMSLGDGFEKKYESEFKNCHGYLRINNYLPPERFEDGEQVEGLGIHTDMSCVTIVYQLDETGGLQVKSKEGSWMEISPCEGSTGLVVNVGDMLQAWSNDKLRSSEHRVVLKQPKNRYSMAFFWCFEDEKVILAPEDVVGDGEMSRMYKPFVCLDYVKFRENNESGNFEKVGFTVKDFSGIKSQML
ncbi:gibberellin 20-oxidase-like protein [Ziziphus jujuba]|uniref:Gibberellin 20-oxidase-like protein n=2 Tax=Ziziphus jujuba TaxID=326968 RepID=A0A6P4AS59_ZIZJJ|nr:gibberellin 20-oxidase-like protein [Ziziphus jujuba]KAH7520285.1 hypothetical protein FEM48_Zijuj08G0127700 [Ziziphus jujuba var. spinosa]